MAIDRLRLFLPGASPGGVRKVFFSSEDLMIVGVLGRAR